MKLYMFQVAPNPTKVRLYIAEKQEAGTEIPVEQVSLNLPKGEHRTPEQMARNPFGKLPVLELDDGTCLVESLAIIDYLEERYPDPPLIGTEPRGRARVRELERIADLGVLLPIGHIVHATNSPIGLPPVPAVAAMFRDRLPDALRYLDGQLADGRPFVAGENPTIADCTLSAALQFGRFGKVDLDPAFQNVARWDRAYRERPAAKSVLVL